MDIKTNQLSSIKVEMMDVQESEIQNPEEEEVDDDEDDDEHGVEDEEEIIGEIEEEEIDEEQHEHEQEEHSILPTNISDKHHHSGDGIIDNNKSSASSGVVVKQSPTSPISHSYQDVRVDNWGNYLLQKLLMQYDQSQYCDLDIKFHTNQLIKVHRTVVNVCTDYFANLERLFGLTDGYLVLPQDVDYQAMLTIVRFFYTGKLEIRGNQFSEVYKTVKLMNITILSKLLEAHQTKKFVPEPPKPRPIVFKQTSGGGGALLRAGVGMKFPPFAKTKTVLARVQRDVRSSIQPQGFRFQQGTKVGHPKKLPIWKDRKFNTGEKLTADRWHGHVKDEDKIGSGWQGSPGLTRFEWGDPDEDMSLSMSSGSISHTLMEKQKSAGTPRKAAEDIFDAVKTQTLGKRLAAQASDQQPPLKSSRVIPSPVPQTSSDDVNLIDDTVEEEVSTTEVHNAPKTITKAALATKSKFTLKPALKSQPTLTRVPSVDKSVRFAPEIEKENTTKTIEIHTSEAASDINATSNHSKIIAQVLKKYPDLVKDKQNIKLKIVHRGAESSGSKDKSKVSYIVLKSTSSPESMGAVLLKKPNHATINKAFWDNSGEKDKKPSGAENTTGPWLCETCGGSETPLVFESYYVYRRHLVDVHAERIDARICEYCGQKASKRNLLLYHMYTKHGVPTPINTNFPNCDRCDYIALSESLLTKHKLTHDATKEYCCEICNASFKSTGALEGHMLANLHRNTETKVYECPYCRKPFVRNINLKGHIRSVHRDIARIEEMDDVRFPHDEAFVNRANMNLTNTTVRKRQFPSILGRPSVPMEILPGDGQQQQVLVTADGHTIEILHGLDHNSISVPMTLVPSSEAESMTMTASSIAASLGLDQGGHDGTTEFITGDGSQAVYIMDNSQPAVEVDMSTMGLNTDGTMIGDDPHSQGQFIVQDIHGNQFRKMTGIDAEGKTVIFFQLQDQHQQHGHSTNLEDGIQMTTDNSVFVSTDMNVPAVGGDREHAHDHEDDNTSFQQESQVFITPMSHSEHDGEQEETIHHDDDQDQQVHIVLEQNSNEEEEQIEEQPHQETIVSSNDSIVHEKVNSESEGEEEKQNTVVKEEDICLQETQVITAEELKETHQDELEVEEVIEDH